jgi:hypothetical protein
MPDGTNNIWVDATFVSPSDGTEEAVVDISIAEADNIGGYDVPTVYTAGEPEAAVEDFTVSVFIETSSTSGIMDTPLSYFAETGHDEEGMETALIDYVISTSISGSVSSEIKYYTGFDKLDTAIDERLSLIVGNRYDSFLHYPAVFWTYGSISGVSEFWANYTNFSGNLTTSGTPIVSYDTVIDSSQYLTLGSGTQAVQDSTVDLTFAGWVNFPFDVDVFSVDETMSIHYNWEATTISGGMQANYLDLFCCLEDLSNLDLDVFCSAQQEIELPFETTTVSGRIGYLTLDSFSTLENKNSLNFDVELLSLKISNFSLGIGEYTEADGYITADVTDDVCLVSTSGTYFKVNGQQVLTTLSGITDGYRLYYDPLDDFETLEGPTVFTVHAENDCGDVLEEDFYLTFGYKVEYLNHPSTNGIDYGYNNKVVVRITAEDMANCPQSSSTAYTFNSEQRKSRDLSASIIGRFYAYDFDGLPASIYPQSTAYFYGKEFEVVVNAKDFAGNEMEPLIIRYRIEDKPE